ncbi:MAG: zinc ribbon domain-containing protein [Armatimonadota bacterium]|nr:MAG: zinc ribbon domain-containing protein [Armatimonadota bacterium]
MAWCPKCGAEYREGVQDCPSCSRPMVDQGVPRPRRQERFAPFLLRRWDEVKRALGYAVEAARVLRRHPSLLLLPLAVAVFNEAESAVGSYIMFGHTAMGREWAEMLRNAPSPRPRGARVTVRYSVGPPAPSVELSGTRSILTAAVQGIAQRRRAQADFALDPRASWVALLFSFSVVAAVSAVVQAGYYGVARQAVATGILRWGDFGLSARRFSFRLWVFAAAVGLIFSALIGILLTGSDYAVWVVCKWFHRVAVLMLVLTPFVIVADDAPVLTAVKRGVVTVGRNIGVAVMLVGGIMVAQELMSWPFDLLRSSDFVQSWPTTPGSVSWRSLAVNLPQRGLLACLSAFFVAAAFVWYRDASASRM